MSRRRRSSCLETGLVVILVFSCLVLAAGAGGYFIIPKMAEQTFGTPTPTLGTAQLVSAAAELLFSRVDLTEPVDPNGGPVDFIVRSGETANSVVARLEENGLVRKGSAFRTFLVYKGLDTSIQAGDYVLSPSMSAVEIARELQDATPGQVEFNILAGWRIEEIAAALPTSGMIIDPAVFLRVARNAPGRVLPPGWGTGRSLEGYLLPGSYQFSRDAATEDILAAFTLAFDGAITDELRTAYSAQGLSLEQAVTLASIIQREAVVAEEQPMIASVFLNRLAQGMKLDSDPTVQYAVGYNSAQSTWWTNPLSFDDLKVDSPYNTYQNGGLPPGPICNPSLSALRAVAYPAQTPYFYFRAACDGSGLHNFARTFDEHLNNACP
jgi:UPF0755 protein